MDAKKGPERDISRALSELRACFSQLFDPSWPTHQLLETCIDSQIFVCNRRLARVRHRFFQDLSAPLSLLDAASAAGLQKNYFSGYFHRKTGISFRRWQNVCRTAFAAWLIANQGHLLSQAAYAAGYENVQTFTRNFKRIYGLTPRGFVALKNAHCLTTPLYPSHKTSSARSLVLVVSTPFLTSQQAKS